MVCDLGIRYSHSFNFNEQLTLQISSAKQSIDYLLQFFVLVTSKLELYKLTIRPMLEYCSFVYGHLRKGDRILLENIQRTFTKSLDGYSSTLTYRERCLKFCLDPLWMRRLKLNLVLLFRIIYGLCYTSTVNSQFYHNPTYNFRNKCKTLQPLASRSKLRSSFILVRYVHVWNSLPQTIRDCTNISQFKKQLYIFFNISSIKDIF